MEKPNENRSIAFSGLSYFFVNSFQSSRVCYISKHSLRAFSIEFSIWNTLQTTISPPKCEWKHFIECEHRLSFLYISFFCTFVDSCILFSKEKSREIKRRKKNEKVCGWRYRKSVPTTFAVDKTCEMFFWQKTRSVSDPHRKPQLNAQIQSAMSPRKLQARQLHHFRWQFSFGFLVTGICMSVCLLDFVGEPKIFGHTTANQTTIILSHFSCSTISRPLFMAHTNFWLEPNFSIFKSAIFPNPHITFLFLLCNTKLFICFRWKWQVLQIGQEKMESVECTFL